MSSQTIWKFPLILGPQLAGGVDVLMPLGSKILTVAIQHGEATLWAEVTPTSPPVTRRFCLVGTGERIPGADAQHHYVGTVFVDPFVFHAYELDPGV